MQLSLGLFGSGISLTETACFNDNSFLALLRTFWYSPLLVVPMHLKMIVCSVTSSGLSHLVVSESVVSESDVLLKWEGLHLWQRVTKANEIPLAKDESNLILIHSNVHPLPISLCKHSHFLSGAIKKRVCCWSFTETI